MCECVTLTRRAVYCHGNKHNHTLSYNSTDTTLRFSTPESDPVLTHQLLGLNPAVETDKIDYPAQTDVTGPMRIRRIKRPIPAGS